MRISAIVLAGVVVAWAPRIDADPRAELQAKGELLAKDGRYADAIDMFKAAEQLQPRASHACLIALAYVRSDLWSQAELFLSRCHARANASDPLPDWVPIIDKQLADRIQQADIAAVTIEVTPVAALESAKIIVSSFARDESFEPRTIYLPLGSHVITAHADRFPDARIVVEVRDRSAKHVVLDLADRPRPDTGVGSGTGPALGAAAMTPAPRHPGRTLLVAGGTAIALGVACHAWMAFERGKLLDARDDNQYEDHSTRFDVARISTVAFYGVGAALVVSGYIARRRGRTERAAVAASPIPGGGAIVTVGWTR